MTRAIAGRMVGVVAIGAALAMGTASPAGANCAQVNQLLAQGFSIGQVANALGAPVDAVVQACLRPVSIPGGTNRTARMDMGQSFDAAGPPPFGAAGPPPFGAAGPPPLGAAGPPPFGAAGPPPRGAAGPPPLGAAGPPPIGHAGGTTR